MAARCGGALVGFGCWMAVAAIWILPDLKAADAAPSPPPPVSYATFSYDINAGLPHNNATPVLQTRDGYLWIGTLAGLARFDGVRFVTYRVGDTPGLADNLIRCLYEDDTGVLWVGTSRGMTRYRRGAFERIEFEGLARSEDPAVTSILQDRAGRLWVSTLGRWLWEYRDGRFSEHLDPLLSASKPFHDVRTLFLDSTGRMWVWVRDVGMAYFEGGVLRPFDGLGVLSGQGVPMAETPSGTLWFGTEQGIFRLRDGQLRKYGGKQGLGNAAVRHLYADRNGQLWVSADKLYLLEGAEAESFKTVPVPVEYARWVTQDHEGSYWLGTATEGLWQIRSSAFRMLLPQDSRLEGNIRAVAVARDGATWASLPNGGAARISPDGKLTVVETDGVVSTLCPAADGSVWLGTTESLRVWREGRQQVYPQFKRVRALFQDRAGAIWIGTEAGVGVVRYLNGEFDESYQAAIRRVSTDPLVTTVASAFAEDAEGVLYIGFAYRRTGVVKLKDHTVTISGESTVFATSTIYAIYPDREGNLWVGTRGRGLAVFSQGRWFSPDSFSAPFNDEIMAITEDDFGNLWLGTVKGILWAPKAELLAAARGERPNVALRQATSSEGIRTAMVGSGIYGAFPAAWKTADGTILFATGRGVVVVEPKNISANTAAMPLVPMQIERVLRDEHVLDARDEIRLPAGTRTLAIEYTALSFVRPGQVLFRYRLEGYDTNWVEAGTRRTAFYTNLAPGKYNFRVIACNSDGVWNATGASLTVVQEPYFYQTAWFWIMGTIVLLLGVLAIYRRRTATLRRNNEELEHRIAERTAELAKSYETLRSSEYFYHSLVESLPQIIVRKDTDSRFTYANAAFGELVGRPVEEILGKTEFDLYPPDEAHKYRADDLRVMETRQTLEYESIIERIGQGRRFLHVKKVPLHDEQGTPLGVQVLFWDMTVFRETEEKLKHAQRELIETSRLAGIAEIATGILHNLGNALNSVNITVNLATDHVRKSRVTALGKVVQLLEEQHGRLAEFFSADARGQQMPGYLAQLSGHLLAERADLLHELEVLQQNVDHIKEIVAAQQSFVRISGIMEAVEAAELVEYGLRISETSLDRHGITVVREFMPAPLVKVERQKVLQILVNLIRNARESTQESGRSDKRVALGVRVSPEGRVQICVTDNGVGIAPENLTQIFAFGFTTKKTGHGFGLHSSALTAKEMGGSLQAQSDGLGQGATFILELPAAG